MEEEEHEDVGVEAPEAVVAKEAAVEGKVVAVEEAETPPEAAQTRTRIKRVRGTTIVNEVTTKR